MQVERERGTRGDNGDVLPRDATTSASSPAQTDHTPYGNLGSLPLRSVVTPRFLDDYHALGSHANGTHSPASLHIVWVTLVQGAIIDMSGWHAYTGQSREQVRGDGWLDAIHPDDRQRVAQAWTHAMRARTLFQTTYRVRRRDDSYVAFAVRCVPVIRVDGRIQEWVWNYTEHLPTTGDTSSQGGHRMPAAMDAPPTTHVNPSSAAKNVTSMSPMSLAPFIPVFEAMADAVAVYDAAGQVCFLNAAARTLFEVTASDDPARATARVTIGDAGGQPFAPDHAPIERILRGASLVNADAEPATATLPSGRIVRLGITGAPLYDIAGQSVGATVILREIHDSSGGSQQDEAASVAGAGRNALAALLALAEAVIFVSDEAIDSPTPHAAIEVPPAIGQRLAALACDVIGCTRAGVLAITTENETLRPVAIAGLDKADEHAWWERSRRDLRLADVFDPSAIERLRADRVLLVDVRQPPYDRRPNPFGISTMLVVPMLVGEQLTGILTLDYSAATHEYTLEEIALAGAVAKLAGLVIERERLLYDRAEAQASVLALREAKRQMDEFLSIASHELRTPLTVIKANVQLITRRIEQATNAERDAEGTMTRLRITPDFLARTQRQIDRLDRLVSDLLDISRIEAGRLVMRKARFDLCAVVREAVEEQRSVWLDRSITLDLPATLVPVDADPDRIGQVVTNYLTNALKYSRDDQHVAVVVAPAGDSVRVAVSDHGPGLTEEQREHLWERFHRVSGIEVQSGSGVGLGLGLHISKTIIERHGGTTDVESTPGHGSTFWFTLPVAPPSTASE